MNEKLEEGLLPGHKLTLISAPAGFGKTTLISEWVTSAHKPSAWLSLDEGDSDLTRFLIYFAAALQTILPTTFKELIGKLQSPQPPSTEVILSFLIDEISTFRGQFIFILDDYHAIDSKLVDNALAFLINHLPQQMHLVISTREDPDLPLAKLRAHNQLTELRAADMQFTRAETAEFLNRVMELNLSVEDIKALETRTEGWIAGLQLAALSIQKQSDATRFIQTFTGSDRFVLDYLLEEVLHQQTAAVQTFLLRTSILERLCSPLCEAVLSAPTGTCQETLEFLERSNLFILPLDNERCWYRYHQLFADLLRHRLQQIGPTFNNLDKVDLTELHSRASQWFEDHDLEIEAFQHAAAANNIDRAMQLSEGKGIPLYHRGALVSILNWLSGLPKAELDKRPALWLTYARALTISGQASGVEEKLQAAEKALQGAELTPAVRDLIGCIASNRATMAYTRYDPETVIIQAQRALDYISPDNLSTRTLTTFTLGVGFMQKGDRPAATQTFNEAVAISQRTGHTFVASMATMALGNMLIMENQLHQAADTHKRALQMFGAQPLPLACESHLGLAQISYEWNNLDTAETYGLQALQLAQQFEKIIDRYILCEIFLARVKLARGDVAGAAIMLAKTEESINQNHFEHRKSDLAAAQIQVLIKQAKPTEAASLADKFLLPLHQARVLLVRGEAQKAIPLLNFYRQQIEGRKWQDDLLKVLILQSIALQANGDLEQAASAFTQALTLARPGGFIRIFLDEGDPIRKLIEKLVADRAHPQRDYLEKLLAAFNQAALTQKSAGVHPHSVLIEPLSDREMEVLNLLRSVLSGPEIALELCVSINTFRTHTKNIFIKLGVKDRRSAIRRAEELHLL